MKVAIMGFGGRGGVYVHFAKYYGSEVVAVCDPDITKKKFAMEEYGVEDKNYFTDEEEFFSKGKIADALVIATLDDLHYRQTIKALNVGYDILLEKPIAMTNDECIKIRDEAKRLNRKVVVCHVLRYSPFYCAIKKLLEEKVVGDIVNVTMSEEIGYYHYAHSYVRGNWRNTDVSTPLILAKNSHDIDIINWIIGKKCISVSSLGGLKYFNSYNAPNGAAKHCVDCKYKDDCAFSCFKIYNNADYEKLAGLAKHGKLGQNKSEIDKNLSDKTNPYSRCVYHCDNNVCDNQIVNISFEDGVSAQFISTAFSETMSRNIKIYCTGGAIWGSGDGDVYYQPYGEEVKTVKVVYSDGGYAHHSGGDVGIVKQFIEYLETGEMTFNVTDIEVSVKGHEIAFLAEESRLNNGKTLFLI